MTTGAHIMPGTPEQTSHEATQAAQARVLDAVDLEEMLAAAVALAKICRARIYRGNSTKAYNKAILDWTSKLGGDPLKIVALATLLEHSCRQTGLNRVARLSREAAICVVRPELKPSGDPGSFAQKTLAKKRKQVLSDLKGMIEKPPISMIPALDQIRNGLSDSRVDR